MALHLRFVLPVLCFLWNPVRVFSTLGIYFPLWAFGSRSQTPQGSLEGPAQRAEALNSQGLAAETGGESARAGAKWHASPLCYVKPRPWPNGMPQGSSNPRKFHHEACLKCGCHFSCASSDELAILQASKRVRLACAPMGRQPSLERRTPNQGWPVQRSFSRVIRVLCSSGRS